MSGFNDREKAFEDKYVHDEAVKFKIQNRRNKLLAIWAAGEMGLTPEETEAYIGAVIAADFEKPGDDDVHDKVAADLAAKGIDLSDHRLRKQMDMLLAEAEKQVMAE